MITIVIQEDLFKTPHLKINNLPLPPFNIDEPLPLHYNLDELDEHCIKILIQQFSNLCFKMLAARTHVYSHMQNSNSFDKSKLDIIDELGKVLMYSKNFKNVYKFADYLKNKVLDLLVIVRPPKDSKFAKNYDIQLNHITSFIVQYSKSK